MSDEKIIPDKVKLEKRHKREARIMKWIGMIIFVLLILLGFKIAGWFMKIV